MCCREQLRSVTTFLLSFFYFVHVSFLFTQKKLHQRLLSAAHAYYARLLLGLRFITPPSCRGFVVLSKAFVVRLHRVVFPHYWRGGSGGIYPRLLLRDSQPITGVRHQLIIHLRCEASYRLEITRT